MSMQFAELTARLQASGVLTDDPVFVDDHLDALIVHRDSRTVPSLLPFAASPRSVPGRATVMMSGGTS